MPEIRRRGSGSTQDLRGKGDRRLTTHVHSGTHEVARKCEEGDDAALDARIEVELGVLEHEGGREAEENTKSHGDGKLEKEDGDTMEEGGSKDVLSMKLRKRPERQTRIERRGQPVPRLLRMRREMTRRTRRERSRRHH